MSMMSATCDRLRERAKVLRQGRWSDGAEDAKTMEDAADIIWELRNKLAGMVDERETTERNRVRNAREYARLCHENDALRELVDYMTPIAWHGASERERDRMRDLGIDVDA